MSRHHILVDITRPSVLHVTRSILWPWSQEARPPIMPKAKAPTDSGQGLSVTMWKGWRGGRVRDQVVFFMVWL